MFDPENQKLRNICYEVILADLISTSMCSRAEGSRLGGSCGLTLSTLI